MTFSKLLQGPSRITTTIGARQEFTRMAPASVEPEFRKVHISYAPVTVRRTFLFPWCEDEVSESLDITATLKLRSGATFRTAKLVRLGLDKAVEYVMLEVVKAATMDKLQTVLARQCA